MRQRLPLAALLVALTLSAASGPASGHEHGAVSAGSASPSAESLAAATRQDKARSYFTDHLVIGQDGQERRFFSDVLKDKVVLIYLFFTNCEGTCPMINQKLAGVQDLLGDRLGTDVTLISITTDPGRDTAAVVREYAQSFAPRPGWLFLTGEPRHIDDIVRRLGHTSADPRTHITHLMLGNVAKAKWAKLRPTASEIEIAEKLRFLADDR
jgi:protein SCO1